jgi:aryl-alcohol dehydrogenase-like predicted oxidoreductase
MRTLSVDTTPPLSVIGLGTWQFGSREWGYGEDYALREAGAIVRRALDLGVTLIDSAEGYAMGRSERIVGEAIAGRRGEAFLATKIFPVAPFAPVVEQRGRASARRLGVDRIDLYQVHFPNPIVPLSMTMEGMRRLQDAAVIAEVGVSNFDLTGWRAAERLLGRRVLSNQVRYNLLMRHREQELLPFAAETGHVVIAYSPLAQGLLSAEHDPTQRPGGLRAHNPLFLPENVERAKPLLDTLREVAAGRQATPAQVALAWVIRHPNVVAIPGASSVAQLESNVAAAELALADDEAAALTSASDAFAPMSGPSTVRSFANRLVGALRR